MPAKRAAMRAGLRFVLSHAAATIVTSPAGEAEARALGARRIERIANGVDVDLFVPRAENKEWDVAFVGRLAPEKDLATLMDATRELSGLRVVFVGDGPLRDQLVAQAAATAIDLTLLGTLPAWKVARILARSRCFVLPSPYEGQPKALLEAMAVGIPCIASRIAAVAELEREDAVVCFEPGNASDLAITLRRLFRDGALATRLGERGRDVVVRRFNLRSLLARETDLLASIAQRRRPQTL
jgi:glycosyltransferase involved in cell wall biosynthesis